MQAFAALIRLQIARFRMAVTRARHTLADAIVRRRILVHTNIAELARLARQATVAHWTLALLHQTRRGLVGRRLPRRPQATTQNALDLIGVIRSAKHHALHIAQHGHKLDASDWVAAVLGSSQTRHDVFHGPRHMVPAVFHQRNGNGRIRTGKRCIAVCDFHAILTNQNNAGSGRRFAARIAAHNHPRNDILQRRAIFLQDIADVRLGRQPVH